MIWRASRGEESSSLHERLARDEDQLRVGQRRRAGAARQTVEQRHFADHLPVLEEVDRRLPGIVGGQVDADDAGDDDIEAVRLVALVEQCLGRREIALAGDPGEPAKVALVEAAEENGTVELCCNIKGCHG